MASSSKRSSGGGGARILPPEVNRILYVRNLPFKISAAELYDIFGAHGAVRQVRLGVAPATRGTAYVVYEDIYDAKAAVERLSGFNVAGRYLIVRWWRRVWAVTVRVVMALCVCIPWRASVALGMHRSSVLISGLSVVSPRSCAVSASAVCTCM